LRFTQTDLRRAFLRFFALCFLAAVDLAWRFALLRLRARLRLCFLAFGFAQLPRPPAEATGPTLTEAVVPPP
jgi:hypothetical protein